MRVLTFLHSFEPGGVERVALRLVRHWRSLGVDAPLFVGRADGALRAELATGLDYAMPRPRWFGSAWCETAWMIATLPDHVRRLRPDVLFCAGSTYTVVSVVLKLVMGRDCPPIVAKISNDVARLDMHPLGRQAWRAWLRVQAMFIDHWVVMDESMSADVVAFLRGVETSVIPDPAVSMAEVAAVEGAVPVGRRRSGGGRRFVAVGRLVPQKDYPLMLRAFARARAPSDTLTVFGDGPLLRSLVRLADALGLTGAVTFAGHVPGVSSRLVGHDVFLMSSAYEGVPAAIVEALAAGLPVISTNCGAGVAGLLEHGGYGRLVGPGDMDGLADAIREATAARTDDEAVREHVRRYTLERSGRRYLQTMERVVRRAADGRTSAAATAAPEVTTPRGPTVDSPGSAT